MNAREQILFWSLATASFLLLLILFQGILLPFIVGLAVAYFLDPFVDYFERLGLPRAIGASMVLGGAGLIVIALLLLVVPLLKAQFSSMAEGLTFVILDLQRGYPKVLNNLREIVDEQVVMEGKRALLGASSTFINWFLSLLGGAWRSGAGFINILGLVVMTPVVAWYLLRDWDRLVTRIDSWLPREHRSIIREQASLINDALASFVRGQATVCLIMAVIYAVLLELVGLNYGLVVGLIAGVTSFIPYVGAAIGFVLSTALAYGQFDELGPVILVAAIFFVGQLIEGNILTPKLVGGRVGLHAVWIVFSLLAGGSLFGFVGMLLAVPVAAVIGVLARFLLKRYLESSMYQGRPADPPDSNQ